MTVCLRGPADTTPGKDREQFAMGPQIAPVMPLGPARLELWCSGLILQHTIGHTALMPESRVMPAIFTTV
jgi:hypothetical protein